MTSGMYLSCVSNGPMFCCYYLLDVCDFGLDIEIYGPKAAKEIFLCIITST